VGVERVIGFVAPLGGPEGVVARPMLEAAREGAAGRAEVLAIDDGRDPARAARAVADLAADRRCVGVVGPKNSGSVSAAAPIAAAAGLPLVLPCATNDDLTGVGVVFRLCATDSATAAAAVALVVREGLEPLAVLADDTAYGRGLAAAVRTAASRAGVAVADDPSHRKSGGAVTDGAVRRAGVAVADGSSHRRAGAVFLAMGEVEQAEQMRVLRAAGCEAAFVSAEGGPGAPLPDLAGPAADGAWLLYPGTVTDDRHVYAAEAHDAAHLLATAGADRAAVRAALASGVGFAGRTGAIAFDRRGERIGATVTRYRVRSGAAVPCR
jgi:branched-chain amino acid transport system substrate-binding protein